ncbi:MAG: SurA N-terminal domain-containing protein, partial [Monoglobaceae bacterium]
MDNENKNLQEEETTMTPEEKVQADISSKIADAAAEVQDEIAEANSDTSAEVENTDEGFSFEETDEALEDVEVKEETRISLKQGTFAVSLIAAALVGALITFFCFRIPAWVANMPEGKTVIKVGDTNITDLDLQYYVYSEAAKYASSKNIAQDELADFDWEKEEDGEKISDKIKQNAVNSAIDEALIIQKGAENGITLSDDEKKNIDSQI